jgi:hypothetical protein
MLLSKSDFKVASTCSKKLKYKKLNYASSTEENDFLKMLAEGGYIVGKLATIMFPGIAVNGNTRDALEQTTLLLKQEKVTLHEAAIQSGQKIIRVDILKKDGNVFDLIEVKAKSFASDDEKDKEKKSMEEYIEDVVFQTQVLQELYPGAVINSWLLLPDKSKKTEIEGLASWFIIHPNKKNENAESSFRKIEVSFVEEEGTQEYRLKQESLITDGLLQLMPLNDKVTALSDVIKNRSNQLLRILNTDFTFIAGDYSIDKNCKDCEYRATTPTDKDGYKECWGQMADITPNIFDLYYGGGIGHHTKGYYYDELIQQKKVSLFDIDKERLKKSDGELGSRGLRQLMQIEFTRQKKEWISDTLSSELDKWQYPLYFIDFETYIGAIPYHKGMKPYEVIAFQWSCHTIYKEGEPPLHTEWINTEQSFPNFRFAQSLMNHIGTDGTPLMWATHENTTLRAILRQTENYGYENEELKNWLLNITKDSAVGREGRLIDMNAFTLQHYFHPYMKGKTSIKKTLPAVWNHHPFLHSIPWFSQYYLTDETGNILDPYLTLKHIFAAGSLEAEMAEKEINEVVKEGGAAMKAYTDMMYGPVANRANLERQLLEYCKLDTLAMVIIWTYWKHSGGK